MFSCTKLEISCFLLLLYFLGNQIEGYGFSLNAFNLSMNTVFYNYVLKRFGLNIRSLLLPWKHK
ncbi:unnamed protein product, partial [Vitis vinifera]|uniref:Uncharacterized protein n=1 Tax=Vitis vinifera TaxID=29760 RepID=D7TCP4_VITVI